MTIRKLNEDTTTMTPEEALASYLEVDVNDISDDGDHVYDVGRQEWFVGTEDEAKVRAIDEIKMLYDDMGLDAFTESFKQYILNNCIDMSAVHDFVEEEIDYFTNDEPDEDMQNYLNNLTDEVEYVKDTLGPDAFEDWVKDKINKDEMAEEAIKKDGIAHFIAYYDGEEADLGDGLYGYRMN